jgi:hypothetical protein
LSAEISTADRLIEKESPLYIRHSGIASLRESQISEYDSMNGKLISSTTTVVQRKDYFYKAPEGTVIRYIKDGKEMPPSDYKIHSFDPVFPICDIHARDNYSFTEAENETVNGIQCRAIIVKPRKITERHFDGKAFISIKDGSLTMIDGTVASLPAGINRMRIIMSFKKTEEGSFPVSGRFEIDLNIPIIYPNRRIITDFTATHTQLIN